MSLAGVFSDHARAAILEAGGSRCLGCGRLDVTCQHRRARGMGGTSDVTIGHPANGVPLCGDGVRGCHGWAEAHPRDARLLGWALAPGEHALEAPFWSHVDGWRRWEEEPGHEVYAFTGELLAVTPPFVFTVYVDPDEDLLDLDDRLDAVRRLRAARPMPAPSVKPAR